MDEAAVPDHSGRTLGNWRLERRLGVGGFGAVYEARNRLIVGRLAAVKVLHPHLAAQETMKRRFLNEASAASQAEHAHIVQFFDGGIESDGLCFVVMELLAGRTLEAVLRQEGALGPQRTARIGRQIAGALAAAHARGVVHRDLKPDNILIVPRDGEPDFVKVLDFGIAKLWTAEQHTATGVIMGTPAYMPPEQWQGASDIDGRADVYALGIILFQCLTGQLPFCATSQYDWLRAHMERPVPDPGSLCETPPWLGRLLLHMTEKDRAARLRLMAEVAEVLDSARLLPPRRPSPAPAAVPRSTPLPLPAVTPRGTEVLTTPTPGRISGASPAAHSTLGGGAGERAAAPRVLGRGLTAALALLAAAGLGAHLSGRGGPSTSAPAPFSPPPGSTGRAAHAAAGGAGAIIGEAEPIAPAPQPRVAPEPAPVDDTLVTLGPGHFISGESEISVGRFRLSRFEVSMAEYRRYVEEKGLPGPHPWDGVPQFRRIAELPANQVTRAQAAAYCAWRYPMGRLPTEAEWEYAARDEGRRPFPFGARLDGALVRAGGRQGPGPVRGGAEGQSSAGVRHLLGNMAEWTAGVAAAARGGHFETPLSKLSPATRSLPHAAEASALVGIRCAADAEGAK